MPKKYLWFALALVGLAIVVNIDRGTVWGKFQPGFVFDDLPVLVHNKQLQSPNLHEAMSWNPFRATVYFTYWLQIKYQCQGTLQNWDSANFRLVNILLHWLAGLALLLTCRMLFPEKKAPAAVAALIFWLNPVFMEAENFILGRTEIMLTIFYLLALAAYLKNSKSIFYRIGFFVCLVLALFCKETAVTIPAAAILLSLYKSEKPKWPEVAGGFGMVIIFFILRLNWTVQLSKTTESLPSWPTYFINQNWIFWFASLKTLLPFHLTFDYNPQNNLLLGFLFLSANMGLLFLAVFFAVRGWKAGWLLLVYPLLYSPLALVPLADAIRESRLYLSGAWLILVFAFAISPAFEKWKEASWGIFFLALVWLFIGSMNRLGVWTTGDLWKDALEKSPDKFRPAYNYASDLRRQLRLAEAKKIYMIAKSIEPDSLQVERSLGLIEEAEKHPELIKRLKRGLEESSETEVPRF